MPSSKDKHSPFKKQLLVCYGTLEETECLTLDCHVAMEPDLPILNAVLFDPGSHHAGHAQQRSDLSGSNIHEFGHKQVLKA